MSCVLRVVGTEFDVEAFLRESELEGAVAFRRGEPRSPEAPEGARRSASGFNLPVSDASLDDPDTQVRDATHFVRQYEDELRRLSSYEGVEEVCLDFARLRGDGAAADLFPADLLWQMGALDIDLVVTPVATLL